MKLLLSAGLLLAGLTASGLGAVGDWTTYHGDAALSGYAETQLSTNLARMWRFNAGAAVTRTPVAAGDTIIVVSDASELFALDLQGRKRWSKKVETGKGPDGKPAYAEFQATPAIVNGAVLLGSSEGVLHAFELRTGTDLWTNSVGVSVAGSAGGFQTADGAWRAMAVAQPDGVLHGFDLVTGVRVWASEPTARCDGCAAVSGGRAVFGSCASALHVIDVANGRLIRTVELGPDRQVAGGVALSGDWAFAGCRDGSLVGVDLRDGVIRWTNRDVRGELFTTPAVGTGRVVFAADDGSVRCVQREDGKNVWSASIGAGRATSPVIAGDKVIAAGNGKMVLLDLSDGRLLGSVTIGDDSSGPALVGRMIVIGGDDGMVNAFGEERP